VIVIRETVTSSSSDSNYCDPASEARSVELSIYNCAPIEIRSLPDLRVIRYEPISIDPSPQTEKAMPIVKRNDHQQQQQPENGIDKGMFNVSRVKKVELSEMPKANGELPALTSVRNFSHQHVNAAHLHDLRSFVCSRRSNEYLCLFSAEPKQQQQQQQQQATVTKSIVKSGSSGKVLHRVITLTATCATVDVNNKAAAAPKAPFVPEKLHFSAYEKFEGKKRQLIALARQSKTN